MRIHPKVTYERVERAVRDAGTSLDNPGFCTACGADAHGVEPDARQYVCSVCGEKAVYGAEELMMYMAGI